MTMRRRMPKTDVRIRQTVLAEGIDLISPPGLAKPGSCRFALNYEADFGGGYSRVGGFERFDGRPSPSDAQYVVLEAEDGFTGVGLGALVIGSTSGAEGLIVWMSGDLKRIALSKLLPGFTFTTEVVTIAASPVGTITNASPSIDGFIDNDIAYESAELYRADIEQVPGYGVIRGVAILKNVVYAWRDGPGPIPTTQHIYKSTATGWELVDLLYRVPFSAGTLAYIDGSSLIQGGVGATILRVVVLAGDWTTADAEGFFVIDAPVGGSFAAGAATGTGACTLDGAHLAQTLQAGGAYGRVVSVVHNFTGLATTQRLYGCDGVNPEFEFDGTTYVPLVTGMGNRRASQVFVHKQHLFFSYAASLQHSAIGNPLSWSAVLGAAELTTGDEITNLINVSGSEDNAALMVTCRDSVWVLYGTSAADWKFVRVSQEAGAQAYSGLAFGNPIAFDRDGFNRYSPTQSFGNFSFESASRKIDPLVRNSVVQAAVLVKNRSRYRCFFSDGLVLTATPNADGTIAWMPCDYDRVMNVVVSGEIAGQQRIFMGDLDGWVLEADVGRSFDGAEITAGMRLVSDNQGAPVTLKQYRNTELQTEAGSAFALALGAEFSDSSAAEANVTPAAMTDFKRQYGVGLFWDFNSWDRSYWDGAEANLVRYTTRGQGRSISLLLSSASDREMPHSLKTTNLLFTPRRLDR